MDKSAAPSLGSSGSGVEDATASSRDVAVEVRGSSSVGRAAASQAAGRGIVPRLPLSKVPRGSSPLVRFEGFVEPEPNTGCHLWTGCATGRGYGCFSFGGRSKSVMAHRFAYEAVHGAIPPGLTIDHLCRNKLCVNPAHLEAVTGAENIRRAARLITHCVKGHPLSGPNLRVRSDGKRACRACASEASRVHQRGITERRRAMRLAEGEGAL